jgi:hypothetical protein
MGTAVHTSIEQFIETGDVPEFKDIFYPLIEKQLLIDPNHREWLSAGSGENVVQGQLCVDLGRQCVDNAVKFLEKMTVWAVEEEFLVTLPGCEVPIRMFIDILGEHEDYGPRIVDWKSGKNKPKDNLQLEVYKAATLRSAEWCEVDFNGYWGMLHPEAQPKTEKARCVDLSGVDPEEIGMRFQTAYNGMKAAIYKANTSYSCRFCWQQDNCKAHNAPVLTDRIRFYDKSSEEGYPY